MLSGSRKGRGNRVIPGSAAPSCARSPQPARPGHLVLPMPPPRQCAPYQTFVVGGAAGGGTGFPRMTMPTIIPTANPMTLPMSWVRTSLFIAQFTASVHLNADAAPAGTGSEYQQEIILRPNQVARKPQIRAKIRDQNGTHFIQ